MDRHKTDITKKEGRKPRLWRKTEQFMNYSVDEADTNAALYELNRKMSDKDYRPDPSKDIFLGKFIREKEFDFNDAKDICKYTNSLKCTELRRMFIYLLEMVREENSHTIELEKAYSDEMEERERLCLKELIRMKRDNIEYLNLVRSGLAGVFCITEKEAEKFEKCTKVAGRGMESKK
ncbi:hypothetical protein ENBRE01_1907 [Enteropsectra breve]|nr:hypothetical protein ENBRE01_1907 [Enteropsectra breve]